MITRSDLLRLAAATGVTIAILAGATSAALAQDAVTVQAVRPFPEVFVARVSNADLNLAQMSGRQTLVMRVKAATHVVCNAQIYRPTLDICEQLACRIGALASANPQIRRAVQRATQIAANGHSAIAPVAIAIRFAF